MVLFLTVVSTVFDDIKAQSTHSLTSDVQFLLALKLGFSKTVGN